MTNATNKTSILLLALFVLSACTPQAQAAQTTGTAAPTVTRTSTAAPTSARTVTTTPALFPASCQVKGTGGERLNVRTGPSMEADIITSLYPGETLKVTGVRGDWYQTEYNNRAAFVARTYCR